MDSINNYYDVGLKNDRLEYLGFKSELISDKHLINSAKHKNLYFIKLELEDHAGLMELFKEKHFDIVVNLAAQAGVRYSIEDPKSYVDRNIIGFFNVLECCRAYPVKHLIYASSSSVYGNNSKIPFSEEDKVDSPISLYAASKKSNELMAHVYSNLFRIPTTGLRFFTVYGPWGRPDMALMLFANAIVKGEKIKIFNHGKMERDFTYVDDIIVGIEKIITKEIDKDNLYKIYNIGNGSPVKLLDFIEILEKHLKIKSKKEFLEIQPGDVQRTYADTSLLQKEIGYKPIVTVEDGVIKFVKWYKKYYSI